MTNLGTLGGDFSDALAINAGGQIVGDAYISGSDHVQHAFLYSDGAMTDLNNLIAPSSGWTLTEAAAINDNEWIVGYESIGSETHAFLLTPAPEPSTIALLGIAAISLVGYAWHRRRN
jgi:probable HAF family extracellular repeat protein